MLSFSSISQHLRRSFFRLQFALALLFTSASSLRAAEPTEYEIKAAMIYRLAQFMEWPSNRFDSASAPLSLAIMGKDPFGDSIDTVLKNQKIGDRDILIHRLPSHADNRTNHHVIYLSTSLSAEAQNIISSVRTNAVFTVGEGEDFTTRGGHARIYLEQKKVRFEINIAAMERSGLKLHSQVMKLATRITRDGKDVKK
ncbi:MAG TPA: YfiR family protein [Verrucomicrobiae bacterium]